MAGAETKIGSRTAGLRLLGIVAALAPAPAAAGAWVAPHAQTIVTTSVGVHEEDSANFLDESTYYESAVYYEAPVGRRTAIVSSVWGEWDERNDEESRGEATVGVKRVLRRSGSQVMAMQASALWVSQPEFAECSEGGAELRVLSGYVFANGSGFLNVESSSRFLGGGCVGGRLDISAGYRPSPNWLAMGQVFYDSPIVADDTVKAQFSIVRFDRSGRGWQIGVRATLSGEDAAPALVLGLWQSSRD